jgi:hypothetical protein
MKSGSPTLLPTPCLNGSNDRNGIYFPTTYMVIYDSFFIQWEKDDE